MRAFVIFLFLVSLIPSGKAQRVCTSEKVKPGTPVVKNSLGGGIERDTLANEIITIPVVIHLLYNSPSQNISEAQILSQLEALNKDFSKLNTDVASIPAAFRAKAADTKIRFCLAKVDPNGRNTSGIIRKYTSKEYFLGDDGMKFNSMGGDNAWEPQRYLNIWVCNMFGRSLGYSTTPGSPADKDGVVINWDVFGTTGAVRAPFNKGRTTTHEVAHWLGLKHIWGDDVCGSDDVEDTPPQKSYNFYCPTFPKVSNCSIDANGDMYMNFMDLTDDACMYMFTSGQKNKMRSLFAIDGYRNSFLNSFQCDSTLATGGALPVDSTESEVPSYSVSIYPNPVIGQLNIIPHNNFNLVGESFLIFNMHGKKVFEQKLSSQKIQIDLSFLNQGIYFLKIGNGAGKKTFKIIKN